MDAPKKHHHLIRWTVIVGLVAVVLAATAFFFTRSLADTYATLRQIADSGNTFTYGSYPSLANADYFATVKQEFIDKKESFIEADLSQMKLRVYEAGAVVKEVPILTKGREGSWWETPAGLYKIESRKESHFSSFGQVYQPWSMAFQGNFFIHGWPHYPDGRPVSSQFSGGCIRLADEDAKAVYDLVSVGTPVLVYEKDFGTDNFTYTPERPSISASSYLAVDLKNNHVFAELDSSTQYPIASLTKLVTALIAAEYINLDKKVTVPEAAIVYTSKARLTPGSEVQAFQLLYPLLLESSNEAAETLARSIGRDWYVSLMNKKAESLGMKSTKFVDPSGAGAGNVSSAADLFSLSKYLYNNRSFVFKISTGNLHDSAYGAPIYTDLGNFNNFPVTGGKFVGGKIGKTNAANETALAVYTLTLRGEERPVAFILIDSDDVYRDMPALVDFVRENYR